MDKKTIGLGVLGVLILVVLVVFVPDRQDDVPTLPEGEENEFVPAEIEAYHYFEEGTHTVFGTIDLPTPCYTLETDIMVAESFPEQVRLIFDAEVDDDIMCTQVITPTDFSMEVDVSEEATFSAVFNGEQVPLTLQETEGEAIQE